MEMEIVQRSGIHPSRSTRHIGGRYMGQFTPEAPNAIDVTVPFVWGTSLTVRRWQLVAQTRGGSP